MGNPSSRSFQLPTKVYRCPNCEIFSQTKELIMLHARVSHTSQYSDVDEVTKWPEEHYVIQAPPGIWELIGHGVYRNSLQFLASRCATMAMDRPEHRTTVSKSFRLLYDGDSERYNHIVNHDVPPLEALMRNIRFGDKLTALAIDLKCVEQNDFQNALRADRDYIIQLLQEVVEHEKDTVLALRANAAVTFLDILDRILYGDVSSSNDIIEFRGHEPIDFMTRKTLYRASVRLSQAALQFTRRIHLSGVQVSAFGDIAGSGSFGIVYKARHRGADVAFKFLYDQSGEGKYPKAFCKEAAILRYLKHPNICASLGVSEQYSTVGSKIGIVTPWISGGSVTTYLGNRPEGWQRSLALHFIRQVFAGIQYLHSMGVIHADLHPGNILVNNKEVIQLVDFGMSNFSNSTSATAGTLAPGAMRYMAPEIIKLCQEASESHLPSRYTEASDIYSCGQVCWHIYTGLRPPSPQETLDRRLPNRLDSTRVLPDGLWACLLACWAYAPNQRPTAQEAFTTLDFMSGQEYSRGNGLIQESPSSSTSSTHGRPKVKLYASVVPIEF